MKRKTTSFNYACFIAGGSMSYTLLGFFHFVRFSHLTTIQGISLCIFGAAAFIATIVSLAQFVAMKDDRRASYIRWKGIALGIIGTLIGGVLTILWNTPWLEQLTLAALVALVLALFVWLFTLTLVKQTK